MKLFDEIELEKWLEAEISSNKEKIIYTEHPQNVEFRKERSILDRAYIESRVKALDMILDSPELKEFISDVIDEMFDVSRNQLWWIAQYLEKNTIYGGTAINIEDRLYEEVIYEQAERFDTKFMCMLRTIEHKSALDAKKFKKTNIYRFSSVNDIYDYVMNL